MSDKFIVICNCCEKAYTGEDMNRTENTDRPEFGLFVGYALFGNREDAKQFDYREAEDLIKHRFAGRKQFEIKKLYAYATTDNTTGNATA